MIHAVVKKINFFSKEDKNTIRRNDGNVIPPFIFFKAQL